MGWVALVLLALGAAGLFVLMRFPRGLWTFAAAGLVLGATGYALQGRPGLRAEPVSTAARARPVDPALKGLRQSFYGRFGETQGYFAISDALLAAGQPDTAAKAMIAALKKRPTDAAIWAQLGLVLVEKDNNQLSSASRLAFEQAMRLAPRDPAPAFFYGLAHIRSGDFAGAVPWWQRALRLSPANAPYRPAVAERLAVLQQFLIIQAQIAADAARQGATSPQQQQRMPQQQR